MSPDAESRGSRGGSGERPKRPSGNPDRSGKSSGGGSRRGRRARRPQRPRDANTGGNRPESGGRSETGGKSAGQGTGSPQRKVTRMAGSEPGSKSILNITNLAIIAIFIGLIIFVIRIASVFGIFLFSFLIAFLLFPTVEWLALHRVNRVWAILIVYIVIGAILFGIGAAVVPAVAAQGNALLEQLPAFSERLWEQLEPRVDAFKGYLESQGVSAEDIEGYISGVVPTIQEWAFTLGQRFASGVQGAVGTIVSAFTIPIIVFYLLLDAPRIRDSLLQWAPRRTASEVQQLLNRLADMLNNYIRGQLKMSFLMFAITTIALLIFGVRYSLLLGLLAGITEVIPIIGPIIALVPAMLVGNFVPCDQGLGLLSGIDAGWIRALIIFAFYMALQYVEGNILVPRIMGKDLNLHPLTVMFALLVGGYLAGIAGMLLSLPIAASLKVVFELYYPQFIERVEELVRRRPPVDIESGP